MSRETPKYWTSLEQLEQTPEFLANVGKEFPDATLQQKVTAMERRDFLKLMGATMALAAAGCGRRPVEKIIPYVNKPEQVTVGKSLWYASTLGGSPEAPAILVKTRDGRPIKLEGNPDSPLNQGALSARGQAAIIDLYSPDRYQRPLFARRDPDQQQPTTWEQVDRVVGEKLQEIASGSMSIVVLTDGFPSPATQGIVSSFVAKFPNARHVAWQAAAPEDVRIGQELCYGQSLTPRYRFDQAKTVVTFGADFLGTWLSPLEFTKGFSATRRVDSGRMSQLFAFESTLSLTGSNADVYAPLRAGDEIAAISAVAHELIIKRGLTKFSGNAHVADILSGHDIEATSRDTGIPAHTLRAAADALWQQRGNAIVLGTAPNAKNAVAVQIIANLLNTALENDGATIDWDVAPSFQAQSKFADILQLIADMHAGRVGALIIAGPDPVYALPPSMNFAAALREVPLVVAHATQPNATTALADIICASPHFLEMWNDASPQRGLHTLGQPAVMPLYDTRSLQDSLIAWANLGGTWYDALRTHWQKNIFPKAGGLSFETFWENALEKGVLDLNASRRNQSGRLSPVRAFQLNALQHVPRHAQSPAGFLLSLYVSNNQGDGRQINNPWLLELPDPISKLSWENALLMSPATASKLSVKNGDIVHLTADDLEVRAPIFIQPKVADGNVLLSIGYGQTHVGQVGTGIGVNAMAFQKVNATHGTIIWSGMPVTISKTNKRTELACAQGHQTLEGRDVFGDTTWADFQKDPASGSPHAHHLPTMWPVHEYKGHKWGMAVDTNACVGCNACMVACQAENNIPVVGKSQVLKGREMYWIRIDRYYQGGVENPDVAYQPMLCQQCDNASCETVCPTLATYHSDDGLNMMAYNRCVGTRYCANNCPYKVRRFNFLEYRNNITPPTHLALNPDVTVRDRGVMEKCTFCIQRIQKAKNDAKLNDRDIAEGDIQTACQQSCPANALVFGDLNDPNSAVSKLAHKKRGYHVLAEYNTKPAITYLTKVRNKA